MESDPFDVLQILVCSIIGDGSFSSCSGFNDASIKAPNGLGVFQNFLYMKDPSSNTVTSCTINTDGSLSSPCISNSSPTFSEPFGSIAFQ